MEKRVKRLFGIDRFGMMIYQDDVIKFFDLNRNIYRVGHLWLGCDRKWSEEKKKYIYTDNNEWNISFNHRGSETGETMPPARNFTRLACVDDPGAEDILYHYFNGYFNPMDDPNSLIGFIKKQKQK